MHSSMFNFLEIPYQALFDRYILSLVVTPMDLTAGQASALIALLACLGKFSDT